MTLTEFLLARLAEDEQRAHDARADAMIGCRWKHYPRDAYEEIQALVLAQARRTLAECEAKRKILKFHESWPVLVQQQPKFEPVDGTDPGHYTFRASQQIAWLTTQEYRARFGDEPPTSPILAALALPYLDHPDCPEELRP